jgi:hypothetical protein
VKLVLGVTVAPYRGGNKTTGDVAQYLEDKYHLMGTFAQLYEGNIAPMLESSVAGALETKLMGGSLATAPFEGACNQIENLFRQAIDVKAYDGLIKDVPTQASLDGVRSHMKNPRFIVKRGKKTKRPQRASFFDTGNYVKHFKCWVED